MKNNNQPSRRQFVKNTSILAGATLLVPGMVRANYFSGSGQTIRVALIGAGGRGTGAALQALKAHKDTRLVAIADAFEDRITGCIKSLMDEEVLESLGVNSTTVKTRIDVPEERRYVGFDAYRKAIAHADVVLLCTPPGFRPAHFEACIQQGKHVFMEKPVAVDTAGVKKVLEAAAVAKQKKLNVVVGLQRRYQNSYRALYERRHLIGEIVSAQAWWNNDGVWVNPRKPGQTEMEYQMRNWYYFNWLCGDHIVEQHIHNIDVVNWFKGDYPVKAQGMGGREVRNGKDYGEIFDHHFVEFHYADGTVLNSQCRHIPGTMSKVDELLIGTKGKIFGDGARIAAHNGSVLFAYDKKQENNPYQNEHDELFAAIAGGIYRFADTEIGAQSTLTAIMGRMATYSGQVLERDKLLANPVNLMPADLSWTAMPLVKPDAEGNYPVAIPGVTRYA